MRVYLLFLLLTTTYAEEYQCDKSIGDELEYYCPLGDSAVTLTSKLNQYVKILCEGTNITCANIPRFNFSSNLPLKSLSLTSCSPRLLRCVNEVISASSLDVVVLSKMTEPLEKEDVGKLGEVRVLIMEKAGKETSIPADALKSIPSLKDLRINGGDFQLTPGVFNWGDVSQQMKYLELSKDKMESLEEGVFEGLGNLEELNMWGNDFVNITVGVFKGITSIKRLTLNSNKLQNIQAGSFSDIPGLSSLVLTGNDLQTLHNGLLQGLDSLENITIKANRQQLKLDTQVFSQLPSIKNIIINFSGLQTLPPDTFNETSSLITLDLSYNKIEGLPVKVFETLRSLRRLDLSHNRISELRTGVFARLNSLKYLNLDRNMIQVLPGYLLTGPSQLQELHIDHNNISTIEWTAFNGVTQLVYLTLASNSLTFESDEELYEANMFFSSPFQVLTKMRRLNLSGNLIRSIFYDWRLLMTQLEFLDLSGNSFTHVQFTEYDTFSSKALTIDLRNNKITHVILDPPISPINTTSPPDITILLDYNPIECDCFNYGLRLRAHGARYSLSEPKFEIQNIKCTSPSNLEGFLLKNIPPKDFICNINEFPDSCDSSIASVATSELILTCQKMPQVLPDLNSGNLSFYFIDEPTINLRLRTAPKYLLGDVHTLNISKSGLKEINFELTNDLKILDASNNYLKNIPLKFLNNNLTLYLAGNPIECNCWNSENIAAIQKYPYIADYKLATCGNGEKISQIDATALCTTWKATMAGLGAFAIFSIFTIIIIFLIYKYSNEILVYMTSRGICKCCITEVMLDKDKEYDVFVSFAHGDYELVQDVLLPKLENEFKQKVCVHYRDWVIGDMIPTQIVRSVESSRKTIIVLSKNFLESMWANLEFCAAHNLALQEGKARVILILLDEKLSKHENLSEELKAYISTNTYLLWDDPKFGEKLYKVLPKVEHKFTWLDFLKSGNTVKSDTLGLNVQLNSEGKLVNISNKEKNGDLKGLPENFV